MLTIKSKFAKFKSRQNEAYTAEDLEMLCKAIVTSDVVNFGVSKVGGGFTAELADRIGENAAVRNAKTALIINDLSLHMTNRLLSDGHGVDGICLAYGGLGKGAALDGDDKAFAVMEKHIASAFNEKLRVIPLKEALSMKMKFDVIIANPPYGKIGAEISDKIISDMDFKEYVQLLPVKDICRSNELIKHVESAQVIKNGAFEDASVTSALSVVRKERVCDFTPQEFLVRYQTDSNSPLYRYIVANFLKECRWMQRTNVNPADMSELYNGVAPIDCGFLVSHRESSNGHLPYSKCSPQYRWNVAHDITPEDVCKIWKTSGKDRRTWGILLLLDSKEERDNLSRFCYSRDGFRFISMQFDAMRSDFAQYWNVFPKVDWKREWTVEEILRQYDYSDGEIEEVMKRLDDYKYPDF